MLVIGLTGSLISATTGARAEWSATAATPASSLTAMDLNTLLPSAVSITSVAGGLCTVAWTPATDVPAGLKYNVDDGTTLQVTGLSTLSAALSLGAGSITPRVSVSLGSWTSLSTVSASSTCGGVPDPPTVVTAVPGDASVTATWPASVANGAPVTGYVATLVPGGNTCSATILSRSCTFAGLANGASYSVSVVAQSLSGSGSARTSASVTPYPASIMTSAATSLWLDGADSSTLFSSSTCSGAAPSSGTTVGCWKDKSARANNASQATTASQPTLSTLNSLPAPIFNGSSSNLVIDGTKLPTGSNPSTIFTVAVHEDTANETGLFRNLIFYGGTNSLSHRFMGRFPNSGAGIASIDGSNVGSPTKSFVVGTPVVLDSVINSAGSSVSFNSALSYTFAGAPNTSSVAAGSIGNGGPWSGSPWKGRIAEVIVLGANSSAIDRRTVREYLARKWGLTLTPGVAPNAPTAVTLTPTSSSMGVSWTAPAFDGGSAITDYAVQYRTTGATSWTTLTRAVSNSTTATITGLTPYTQYDVQVLAINDNGTSPASVTKTGALATVPGTPTSVTAVGADSAVAVAWTAPGSFGGAASVTYTATASPGGLSCTATSPTNTCTVTGLTNGTSYAFTVVASNAVGNGPTSLSASATPEWSPATVSGVAWWYDASNAVNLTGTWTNASYTVTGTAGSSVLQASSGVIERVDVTATGSGYTSSPTVAVSGGGGTGTSFVSTAFTIFGGGLTAPQLSSRGSGYTSEPTLTLSGGGGSGGAARARIMAPAIVGSQLKVGSTTYTVTEVDGLAIKVTPALTSTVSAATPQTYRVSSWRNSVTPGTWNATQSTSSAQPSLGAIGSRNAVAFGGFDDYLDIVTAGTGSYSKAANWTAFVAYQSNRQIAPGAVSGTNGAGGTYAGSIARILGSSGAANGTYDYQSGESLMAFAGVTDAAAGGPVRVTTLTSSGANTFAWTLAAIGSTVAGTLNTRQGFTGRIGEVIFVNNSTTAAEKAKAVDYLTRKWSTSTAVPDAPITTRATPGNGSLAVTWRAGNPNSATVTGYTATATATGQTTRTCTTTGALTCTISGLTNFVTYTVTVTATAAGGTSSASLSARGVPGMTSVTGLLAAYPLNESSGATTAADVSPNQFDATYASGVTLGASPPRSSDPTGALTVSSSGGAASTAPGLRFSTASPMSMSMWVKVPDNGIKTIASSGTTTGWSLGYSGSSWQFTVSQSLLIRFLTVSVPMTTPVNSWVHLAVTYDGSASAAGIAFYINGIAATTTTVNSNITGSSTSSGINLGRDGYGFFPLTGGGLDDVQIFDRVLTAGEVTTLPATPTQPATASTNATNSTVSWTAPASVGGSAITGYVATATASGQSTQTCSTTGALTCTLAGLTTGVTYTVTVAAINAIGTGPVVSTTIVGSLAAGYRSTILADTPTLFWRFDESSGSTTADSASTGVTGTLVGHTLAGIQGIFGAGSSSLTATNGTNFTVYSSATTNPSTFSAEVWFKTTTTSGGKLMGIGNGATGTSSNYDRHVYMAPSGRLVFGVYPTAISTISSPQSYNDGQWHHVVATQGSGGAKLYVDGLPVASSNETVNQNFVGYWRVGGDNVNAWPEAPTSTSYTLAGNIDEVAAYSTALTPARVLAHYQASGRSATATPTPTDTYGTAVVTDGPFAYWRLGESSGLGFGDSSGNGNTGRSCGTGITYGTTGAVGGGNTAISLTSSSACIAAGSMTNNLSIYSVGAWIRTTTTSGGRIIGYGALTTTAANSTYDRVLYLQNNGRVNFTSGTSTRVTLTSTAAVNDGAWHYVVATQGAAGMALYVDGKLVASNSTTTTSSYRGYWRIGNDTVSGLPNPPTNLAMVGDIDDVGMYSTQLPLSRIQAHYTASGRTIV